GLTLHIAKELRHGKMLLDIYRNRTSQTIVAAYSLRGINGAPVSTPLHWEELKILGSPAEFDMQRALKRVLEEGDPWEAMEAYATPLHTLQKPAGARAKKLDPARTRKTPAQLKSYSRKRSFKKTPEPEAVEGVGGGHAFVVHRHHATRLHYDLRLERDGVLKSWALPKGLPPRPGILRLAVSVEDHPLEYVNFDGAIPKGEYGGGMMWKFAQGRYQITKEKEDGFYFRLQSRELNGEYRMHRTKEKEWLLERVDNPQTDWLRKPLDPMLARAATVLPDSDDYLFEVKWDGIRALVSLDEGEVRIHGRNHLDITVQFPELLPAQSFRATSAVFDGEIVCLDAKGKPVFGDVIHRMQQKGEARIARASAGCPAVCYLFDCLYLDGRAVANEPFTRRREWLADAVRKGTAYRISEAMEDGKGLLAAVREMGLEGIMAKQRASEYTPGKRNDSWLKIKTRLTMDCVIIGYTPGKGDRESYFGALHLAEATPRGLKYVGKAGSGFDERALNNVSEELRRLKTTRKPVKDKIDGETLSTWVEPKLICEVQYMTLTPDGTMREPVFLRLRPDLYMEA
ncbi:MAG TPA: non-homologous end-joining DNA ligase, partial [Chthoniobacteraceae bacterium]|nr:non-homologous end-joining DNA ligase [Chthoniobacteraceae bacterium]